MSVSIHIRRNRILVQGYDLDKKTQGYLPKMLTVFNPKTKRYENDKTYSHLLKNGDIIFPRTYDVQQIVHRLMSQNVELEGVFDETNDWSDINRFDAPHIPFELKPGISPKSEFQAEGIKFLTDRKNPIHFSLLSLPTGEGKTVCGLAAMCYYNRKTLIVANSLSEQWIEEILNKTNVKYDRIYEISGINSIEKILDKRWNDKLYDVYVAQLRTLENANELGLYDKFCKRCGIGLKITDEVHLMTYSNILMDMSSPIADYIYLSATPARSSPAEDWCMKKAFRNLPSFGEEVASFKRKYLNTIYVTYDSKPKYYDVKRCTSFYGFNLNAFEKYTFDITRRDTILNILKWAIEKSIPNIDNDDKIVIIVRNLETIRILEKNLSVMFSKLTIGNYSSDMPKELKRKSLDNKIILSTDKSFGTGSDLKGKLRVLINATTYNSKVTAKQLPGRLREIPGKNVYYIDLVDFGFKRTYDHYRNRSKIINSYSQSVSVRKYGIDI